LFEFEKRDLGNLVLAHGLLEAGDAGVLDVSVDDNQVGLARGKDPLAIGCHVHTNDGVYGGNMKIFSRKEEGTSQRVAYRQNLGDESLRSC